MIVPICTIKGDWAQCKHRDDALAGLALPVCRLKAWGLTQKPEKIRAKDHCDYLEIWHAEPIRPVEESALRPTRYCGEQVS